ncbi:MAG: TetR/AcrR family transcriptional regulator [Pseudomonadota bacterium]
MIYDDSATSGRPGRPKSEEKRENISHAAAQLFLTQGFEKTSMDNIAHTAGVSKQTVYSHFQNKDDLFGSCIRSKISEYDLAVDASQHESLASGLRAMADGFLGLLSDPRVMSMWRLVINESTAHAQVAKIFFQTGPQATYHHLASFLKQHQDELAVADFNRTATTFLAIVGGPYQMPLMLGLIDKIPEEERASHVEKSTQQFLRLFGKA